MSVAWDGEPECPECEHLVSAHGPNGCEVERGDKWVEGESMGAWVAMGPCGCRKVVRDE